MKKIVFTVFIFFISITFVSAINLSFFAGSGYGLGLGRDTFGYKIQGSVLEYMTYSVRPAGIGQGPKGFGEIDVSFSDYFAVGLGAGYSKTIPLLRIDSDNIVTNLENDMSVSFVPAYITLKGQVPAGNVKFIFGVGPSTCFFGKSEEVVIQGDQELKAETFYSMGWGFHGLAGIAVGFGKRIALHVRVRAEQLTFRQKESVILSYKENGVDKLSEEYPDTADREVVYVEDLSNFLNNPFNPDAPFQALAYNIAADSISLIIGCSILLF